MMNNLTQHNSQSTKKASHWLLLGIFFIPYVFAWFTLGKGYSTLLKIISFSWLILALLLSVVAAKLDKKMKNVRDVKMIAGSVFPANEICNYQNGTVLDKYGNLSKKWQKVSYDSKDPNAVYFCEPTDKALDIVDSLNNITISLEYEAWGGRSQGADIIKLEYWAKSNGKLPVNTEQSSRTKILIPYCNDVSQKALKNPLSETMLEKLMNPKTISSPIGVRATPFCEKAGQGFVCITSNISESDNIIDFKLFASEESYQHYTVK